MRHPLKSCGQAATLDTRLRLALLRFCYMLTLAALVFAVKPVRAHADLGPSRMPQLRLASAGWGSTTVDELRLVLDAVARSVGKHFPDREPPSVQVVPGEGNPLALYDRGEDGAYIIQLSARHSRWHQFVYQFSHELCHVYSNFDRKTHTAGAVDHRNQWFEESVCEAVALHTLNALAAEWTERPPSPRFAGYGDTLRALSDYLQNEPHRRLGDGTGLADWFSAHRAALESDPYQRDMNEVVANRLLRVFEHAPGGIGAIGFLNLDDDVQGRSFAAYLTSWRDNCPEQHRATVSEIMALFNTAPAPLLAASAASLAQR